MSSQLFDLTGSDTSKASSTITVGAGEKVRIRFNKRSIKAEVYLAITANALTTQVPIDSNDAWITDGLFAGDEVGVLVVGGPCEGIIESAT